MSSASLKGPSPTLFGHPTGLFTLFFAEMWERFSFYGMRALLVLYMSKGFLQYSDDNAYVIYAAYGALVYMTPFFGGLFADRFIGCRRAVVLGGLLMAGGHLMMGFESKYMFFGALGMLIAGNGFFKPNISTMVGSLYPEGSPRRDGGFTIFYMGVNLGAALAPLLCGYIGETYGYHFGFGLATIGMLVGLAVFVMPTLLTQVLIAIGAGVAAVGTFWYRPDHPVSAAMNIFVAAALLVSGGAALLALGKGGLPGETGGLPESQRKEPKQKRLFSEWCIYLGTLVLGVPLLTFLVSGGRVLPGIDKSFSLLPQSFLDKLSETENPIMQVVAVAVKDASTPAGLILTLSGLIALFYLLFETFRLEKVARHRMYVVGVLTFFSLLFWSFFEQAGSSLNLFTDRNVDRVTEERVVTSDEIGKTISFRIPQSTDDSELVKMPPLTQEQLGHIIGGSHLINQVEQAIRKSNTNHNDDLSEEQKKEKAQTIEKTVSAIKNEKRFTMTALTFLRNAAKTEDATKNDKYVEWTIVEENVKENMGIGGTEVPASVFQSVNPIFILLFGLPFTFLWTFLGTHRLEPSTPFKFALGLLQLGLGFGAFWYGAEHADQRGMVLMIWLILGYLLQTTGELCLSPVGLSMVTKLSPAHLVSTVMGVWFLATSFSHLLAGIISQFTGVSHGDEGSVNIIPIPIETIGAYRDVFGSIAVAAMGSALICFMLWPLLTIWMHSDVTSKDKS